MELRKQTTRLMNFRVLKEWRKRCATFILCLIAGQLLSATYFYWNFHLTARILLLSEAGIVFVCSVILALVSGVSTKLPVLLTSSLVSSAAIGVPAWLNDHLVSTNVCWEDIGVILSVFSLFGIGLSIQTTWKKPLTYELIAPL